MLNKKEISEGDKKHNIFIPFRGLLIEWRIIVDFGS